MKTLVFVWLIVAPVAGLGAWEMDSVQSNDINRSVSLASGNFIAATLTELPVQQSSGRSPLHDSLKATMNRIERLQSVLDKVTFGPQSYYFTRLRSWSIPLADVLNDSIAQYFFEVLDNDSSFIESRGDIQVIATPEPSTDLVAMYFSGNGKEMKGQRLREALEKKKERQMYSQILESREYSEDKELIDRNFRIVENDGPHLIKEADSVIVPFDRYSYVSVDHRTETILTIRIPDNIRVRFGNLWGAEVKLGNDEYGLPFWSSGNVALLAIYNQVKVGVHIPFKWGAPGTTGLTSFLKPRVLNGTVGVSGEFDWAFAGGSFLIGFPRTDVNGTYSTNRDTVYSLQVAGTVWYSFTFNTNNKANLFRIKTGAGIEQIGIDFLRRTPGGAIREVRAVEDRFVWSPFFRVDYMNQQFDRRFGGGAHYFRERIFATLWMEILPEQLRVELKYSTNVASSRDSWEIPYIFAFSIPYTFSL